jgi:hypothetical protein
MADPEKTRPGKTSAYRVEAAARRAKIASKLAPIENELNPVAGRIRATLNGKTIRPSASASASVIGPTSINIPEFSFVRKRKQD